MKKLALITSLFAVSAQAADYDCNFRIEKDGQFVGGMGIGQDVGMSAGRIYTLPISVKKNLFGKTIETVEVTLDGMLFNGGESNGNTGIDATFTLVTTNNRRIVGSRATTVTKVRLASIKGLGNVSMGETGTGGYFIRGGCEVNE